MRKSQAQKNADQRKRQRTLRARAKAEQRPSRDDIARVLLHWTITKAMKKGQEAMLYSVADEIVSRLAAQGFDEGKAYDVFDELVERYTKQHWAFRRKTYLPSDTEIGI